MTNIKPTYPITAYSFATSVVNPARLAKKPKMPKMTLATLKLGLLGLKKTYHKGIKHSYGSIINHS